jgi:3-methyladenine DNA glycosylase/8-oxoguanine DNA glycosylase
MFNRRAEAKSGTNYLVCLRPEPNAKVNSVLSDDELGGSWSYVNLLTRYSRPNIKKMSNTFSIPTPENFNFPVTVGGHGWYDLPPFEYEEEAGTLSYAFTCRVSGDAESVTIRGGKGKLRVALSSDGADEKGAAAVVRHVLRLDEELDDFYRSVEGHEHFTWVAGLCAGRLLRSGTVFEDLVKTMCTTNCSWSLTRSMTRNMVDKMGSEAADGRKAFPTPEAMAAQGEDFYRNEVRAGYRSPYFVELAEAVVSGKLDPEKWLTTDLPTPELRKEIKNVKGIGDYAADNLLKLLGRYDGLALDSWLRAGFYKRHNREKPCPDKKIEKHYRQFGKWKGLAIWCDMTRDWFLTEE